MEHTEELPNFSGKVEILSYRPVFRGPYSTVYQGKLKHGDEIVAIKVLHGIQGTAVPTIRRKIKREGWTWNLLRHSNILPLYGFADDDDHFQPFGAFISPWCQRGDMAQYIQEQAPSAPLNERLELWKGVVAGVEHLHTHNPVLVHGDLKPRNILIDDHGKAQLCDFGLVRVLLEEGHSGMTTTTAHTGTLRYLAYELVTEEEHFPTMASDIYATGCIGLEIIFGQAPYSNHANGNGLLRNIRRDMEAGRPLGSRPADLSSLHSRLWETILWCCSLKPSCRPRASELVMPLEHFEHLSQGHETLPDLYVAPFFFISRVASHTQQPSRRNRRDKPRPTKMLAYHCRWCGRWVGYSKEKARQHFLNDTNMERIKCIEPGCTWKAARPSDMARHMKCVHNKDQPTKKFGASMRAGTSFLELQKAYRDGERAFLGDAGQNSSRLSATSNSFTSATYAQPTASQPEWIWSI